MCHDRLRPPAEQPEELVDETPLSEVTGDDRLEDVGVADLLCTAQRLLLFEAIDDGLNRRVGRATAFGKGFLNLADGQRTAVPQHLHHLELESTEFAHVRPRLLRLS